MRPRGSAPSSPQSCCVSGYTGTVSRRTVMACPQATLNSSSAVAKPPSVMSCRARTPAKPRAMRASSLMLSRSSRCRHAASCSAVMPRVRKRSGSSPASRAVPSIASALVSSTWSPSATPRLSRRSARGSVPSMVAATTGLVTAAVISVWPPTSAMPAPALVAAMFSSRCRASDGVVPAGRSTVVSSQRGSPPEVAMSLALTSTAKRPRSALVSVMGSPCTTITSSPLTSSAATSSPTPAPTSTAGSATSRPPR